MMQLETKVREYRNYKRMRDEVDAILTTLADELKVAMDGKEKMVVGEYKLSHTPCIRKDIDKKRLEADHTSIYNDYLKEVKYMRFMIT